MRPSLAVVLLAALAVTPGCATIQNYLEPSGPRYAGSFLVGEDDDALKLVTFNIKYARHVDRAVELLTSEAPLRDADVVALQEMDAPGVEQIARALGMAYVYYPAAVHPGGGKDFGNAVLVRGLIEEDHKLVLPHPGRFGGMRRIAVAVTARVAGRRLRIYSTHLGTPKDVSSAARRAQVAAIVQDAAGVAGPVLVAGDCNARDGVATAFESAGFDWVTRGVGPTIAWFSWDHVFVRGLHQAAPARSGAVDSRGASDHRAVWVELPVQPPAHGLAPGLSTALPAAMPATP